MLSVAVSDSANKCGDDNLRAFATHSEHGIVEYAVMAPFAEGLFLRLGESEIYFSSPHLLCAVILAGFQEFIGADDSESVIRIRGHRVLAAFATRECEQSGTDTKAAREISEQRSVFVVGVGDNHHHAGGGAEAF